MSRFLFLTLDGLRPSDVDLASVKSAVEARCRSTAAAKLARELRIVARKEEFGATLEPFSGSAAFQALLENRGRREAATVVLKALIAKCLESAHVVGLAFLDASKERFADWPVATVGATIEEALAIGQRGNHWIKFVTPGRVFHFRRVEARLWQPLQIVGTSNKATHFFQEFWVFATSAEQASMMIRASLERDEASMVVEGEWVASSEPMIPTDGTASIAAGIGVLKKSARVYFSD